MDELWHIGVGVVPAPHGTFTVGEEQLFDCPTTIKGGGLGTWTCCCVFGIEGVMLIGCWPKVDGGVVIECAEGSLQYGASITSAC